MSPRGQNLSHSRTHPCAAFTLVEILVVIGIVATLIAITLPVISRSRQNAATLKCAAQLRQQYHGLSMYAADNKGRLPYGVYAIRDADGNMINAITWQTIVHTYFNPKASLTFYPEPGSTAVRQGDSPSGNLFVCPAVPAGPARSSYACNMLAMPDKDFEERSTDTSKQPLLRPSLMSKLYPHNILLFDTSVAINSDATFVVGVDVDWQYFTFPSDTLARFFRGDDPYQGNPAFKKYRGNASPIITDTKAGQNQDWFDAGPRPPGDHSPYYPYQGNVRYRHNGDRIANFAFADGHVESLPPVKVIRYMFKLRWPAGMPISAGPAVNDDEKR